MPTIYWYGSCPLLRNLKIEELWELNQDQKGLQNPQENQTGVNETIKKRQVTHLPSNLIITKRGTKNGGDPKVKYIFLEITNCKF